VKKCGKVDKKYSMWEKYEKKIFKKVLEAFKKFKKNLLNFVGLFMNFLIKFLNNFQISTFYKILIIFNKLFSPDDLESFFITFKTF
jgi:hypothetical protein